MTPQARKRWEREQARFLRGWRKKVLAEPGVKLLASKVARPVDQHGHRPRERFDLITYRAPGAPRGCYVVLVWRRVNHQADVFFTRAEAKAHYDHRACAPDWLRAPEPEDEEEGP